MRIPLVLAALLAVAPAAHAQQATPPGAPFQAHATSPEVRAVTVESRRAVDPVRIDAPADAEEVREQLPQRGSFWWVVGAIVVAGVILAVVL